MERFAGLLRDEGRLICGTDWAWTTEARYNTYVKRDGDMVPVEFAFSLDNLTPIGVATWYTLHADEREANMLAELCAARRLLGLSCPGCGLTRSFISLAHGDLATAWSYNPAGLWLFAIIALQIPFRSIQLFRIRHKQAEISIPWAAQFVLLILAIALLSQWTLRLAGVSF